MSLILEITGSMSKGLIKKLAINTSLSILVYLYKIKSGDFGFDDNEFVELKGAFSDAIDSCMTKDVEKKIARYLKQREKDIMTTLNRTTATLGITRIFALSKVFDSSIDKESEVSTKSMIEGIYEAVNKVLNVSAMIFRFSFAVLHTYATAVIDGILSNKECIAKKLKEDGYTELAEFIKQLPAGKTIRVVAELSRKSETQAKNLLTAILANENVVPREVGLILTLEKLMRNAERLEDSIQKIKNKVTNINPMDLITLISEFKRELNKAKSDGNVSPDLLKLGMTIANRLGLLDDPEIESAVNELKFNLTIITGMKDATGAKAEAVGDVAFEVIDKLADYDYVRNRKLKFYAKIVVVVFLLVIAFIFLMISARKAEIPFIKLINPKYLSENIQKMAIQYDKAGIVMYLLYAAWFAIFIAIAYVGYKVVKFIVEKIMSVINSKRKSTMTFADAIK